MIRNTDEKTDGFRIIRVKLSLEKSILDMRFSKQSILNKEYLLGNIDEGYLISPGDKIRIIIYGDNSLEVKRVTVDRNGNIKYQGFWNIFCRWNDVSKH